MNRRERRERREAEGRIPGTRWKKSEPTLESRLQSKHVPAVENTEVIPQDEMRAEIQANMPPGVEFDGDVFDAGFELLMRMGMSEFVWGYEGNAKEGVELPLHFAHVRVARGVERSARGCLDPVTAVDKLVRSLLADSRCAYCAQDISIVPLVHHQYCVWIRVRDRWVRGCLETHDDKAIKIRP